MLLDKDRRKGMATAIISKIAPEGSKNAGSEERSEKKGSDKSAAKRGSMNSFLDAVNRKDADGMVSALSNFHDLHSSGGDDDDEVDSGDGEQGPASEAQKMGGVNQTRKEWS